MLKSIAITISLFILGAFPALAANSATNFGGTGIDGVPWASGQIVVRQMVRGGPAHLAGMKVGDIITHIDGKPTEGGDFRDMVEHRLRGVAGTQVTLKVRRPGIAKAFTFHLTRRQLLMQKTKGK
ncbi:PDZ domain-containing protein [Geotalea sp. SG265]|uniref:S41 family peptidase n=1 Tax=Geotalea sp. SG265 TaxID=2922867 RepID=UPI001FAFB256|nr:PDZ domain-containing protein [Geotalea sp. SG265]